MKVISMKSNGRRLFQKVIYLWKPEEIGFGMMFFQKGTFLLKSRSESKLNSTIHTFLCRTLKVAWLDKSGKVVDVKICKPWRIYVPKKDALYVLETTELDAKIKVGDKISLPK